MRSMRMFLKILSSAFAMVMFSTSAYAFLKCDKIFLSEYGLSGRIEVKRSGQDVVQVKTFEDAITRADSLLGTLSKPSEVQISIDGIFALSSYDPIRKAVSAGVLDASTLKKNPNLNTTVLVHEYGHAILDKNLLDKNVSYQEYFQSQLSIQRRADNAAYEVAVAKMSVNSSQGVEKANAEQKLLKLQENLKSIKAEKQKLEAEQNIYNAFHEYFADLTSVVTHKNAKVMHQMLLSYQASEKRAGNKSIPLDKKWSAAMLSLRNFETHGKQKSYQVWKSAFSSYKDIAYVDYYFVLLPTRWATWDMIEKRIGNTQFEKQILSKVFDVLSEHVTTVRNMSLEQLQKSDYFHPEKLNTLLIQDIQKALD